MPQSIMPCLLPPASALAASCSWADATDLSGLRNDHTKRRNNLANWLLSFKLIVCAQIVYTQAVSVHCAKKGGGVDAASQRKLRKVCNENFTLLRSDFEQCRQV